MIRKIFRVLSLLVVVIFAMAIIISGAMRNSYVQTFAARIVAIHLSEYLDTHVKIDKLQLSAFLSLHADGVEMNDLKNKPLIHLDHLYLSADLKTLFSSGLNINRLEMDSARFFLRRYAGVEDFNFVNILNRFRSIQNENDISDSLQNRPKSAFKVNIDQLEIANSQFVYQIEDKLLNLDFGIDYYDLDIQDIQAKMHDISIVDDSIHADIEFLRALEKSGVQINKLNGILTLYDQGAKLENAYLETGHSDLQFQLGFSYETWEAYNNFIDDVTMDGTIEHCNLNFLDITYFAPELEGMNNLAELSGSFVGPVRNLRARNLLLNLGNTTKFDGNAQLTGLPNIYETFISLRVREFTTSVTDIEQFKLPLGNKIERIPDELRRFKNIAIKGNFTGFYNDFVSNASFKTNIGQLTTDIQFSNNPQRDIIEYRGDFQARKFNLGAFLDKKDSFGKLDFDLNVKGEGLTLEDLYADVVGKINNFQFKGKQLQAISVNGLFQERQFNGDISINDSLIKAEFGGHINFDTIVPVFDFNLKLSDTYLALLGLLPVDSSTILTSQLNLNFSGNTLDNIRGDIRLDSTTLFYKGSEYKLQSFKVRTASDKQFNRSIRLTSDYLDGEVDGQFQLSELRNTANQFFAIFLPHVFNADDKSIKLQTKNMIWDLRFKDLSPILPLLEQPIQISENGHWHGDYDAINKVLSSQMNWEKADYSGVVVDNLRLNLYTKGKQLFGDIDAQAITFKPEQPTDTLRLGIDNLHFTSSAANDSIQFGLQWKNNSKYINNNADIAGFVNLANVPQVDLKLRKADLVINDTIWYIQPENRFQIAEGRLLVEKVGFYSGSQLVDFTGIVDQKNEQALKLTFKQFNLSNFDILMNYKGIDIDGYVNGNIQFLNVLKNIDFLADLNISGFKVNKENIGDASISSKRNVDKSIFISAKISNSLRQIDALNPLLLEGFYLPEKMENSLDFTLSLNKLPIQVSSPFLYKWVDRLTGTASGNMKILGTPLVPDLKGNIRLDEVGFRIIYLNTDYKLSANALVENSFIDIRNADFRDEQNNQATIYGGLSHNHLKDFGVDISILAQNFMGLNTRKGMNSLFYGKAFLTGTIDIRGPFDAVELNINAESNRGSQIVIPISLTADVSENEFITFINTRNKVEEKVEKKEIQELSTFSLNMDLSLNPDAQVEIILPEDLGNIQGQGYGDLNMNLNRAGNFTMAGDYQINKGTFLFTVKNVYKKRFDLVEGGTISWTGDPYAGELNMKAIYHVKTSLNTLGATQDTSFRSRVPVNCVIGLKDQILNPTVKFGFEFPNSSEEIRQFVFSQIDTTNEAETSQQMLSLLVLNSFSFANGSGAESFSSSVGGSSLQLVANQLSNWLSQISKDVDVGIKYRPGGAISNEEVEVALSTQLFDERVTIDGNFGYQDMSNMPSANTSNIVGDINVEVKIAKDGRFRLKVFNRTNTLDVDNVSPYTQGVGVFYRKEFDLFKDLFIRKKKKEKIKKKADSETEELTEPTPDRPTNENQE